MALFEPVNTEPILGIEDGQIALAATVVARVTRLGNVSLQVLTWEAGLGQRVDYLSSAEFESWRRSFAVPDVKQ